MKVIFLDIDGVLNFKECRARSLMGYKGISDVKLKLLKEIVQKTNAEIVLISTWKREWRKDTEKIADPDVMYLIRKFRHHGLTILDKTFESRGMDRGQGIYSWLALHDEVSEWVVLDDEIFSDYEQYGIITHLVKTEYSDSNGGGLQPRHVERAIVILGSRN